MRKNSDIVIYNPEIAKDLILKGYRVINIAPSRTIPQATVFYFNNLAEIRAILKESWGINIPS